MSRSFISGLRSILYTTAKLLGDVSAVQKGPQAIERRIFRRIAGRATGKLLGTLFKNK